MKDIIISFLLGLFLGVVSVLTWMFTDSKGYVPRKLNVASEVVKAVSAVTPVANLLDSGDKRKSDFFLGFEDVSSLSFFQLSDGLYTEITDEKSTDGKHSLFMEFPQGARYPGLYWEVYRKDECMDWNGKDSFGFDVFNNSEGNVYMTIKIKSGASYPKKAFEEKVILNPHSWTQIRIPIKDMARYIDIGQVSYIKIFIPSPKRTVELFLDKLGVFKENSSLSSQSEAEAAVDYGFKWGLVSPLEKIIPVRSYLGKRIKLSSDYTLRLAKGENEGVQLLLFDVRKDRKIKLKVLPKSGGGNALRIRLFREYFVETKHPYYRVTYVGKWPDPMIELKDNDLVEIVPKNMYVFWLDFEAPLKISAGEYSFDLQILGENDELLISVPIVVKVWNFSIPRIPSLRTAFDVYDEFFAPFFPRKKGEDYGFWKERLKKIKWDLFDMLLEYRISPMIRVDPSNNAMIDGLKDMKKKGLTGFCIGKYGGSFGNNWPRDEEKLNALKSVYRDYAHRLRNASLLDIAYIYTWDEGKIGDPFVAQVCSMIHEADPQLKNMVCYHGFWDPDVLQDWGDDIDIWCFQIASYNEMLMNKLQKRGMEIWIYVSGPDGQTPNLVIDSLGIEHRILPWIIWNEKINGLLYWAVNFWRGGDPWKNTFNTPWQQNGNGLLCYPYKDEIIPTVRLFMLRDGLEDYEYLKLLEKFSKIQDISLSMKQKIRRLLDMSVLFDSFYRYIKDGEQLLQRRREIGNLLEDLEKLYKEES